MEQEPKVQIVVATHKKYMMPKDKMYLPLHVGAEGKVDAQGFPLDLGYQKDNLGENISEKNAGYCELTGLYWAWKNIDADYIGLVHYRRYFKKRLRKSSHSVLTYKELKPLLNRYRVFVPKKRKYYIETLYSHYAHTHYAEQLDITRMIIREKYPDYLKSFDKIVNQRYGYMFNMVIMQKKLLDSYCNWLFDILFELENRINEPGLSAYQGRFYGRIGEIIFNVWLEQNIREKNISKKEVCELPYIHTEKINWWKKGTSFIRAKFFGEKYEGSF